MKEKISTNIKYLMGDRQLMISVILLIFITLAEIIYIALSLKPSELQLVNRYSAFGEIHLYRNQWYYLLTFVVFALSNAVISISLAIKLYATHSRLTAFFCIFSGILITVIAWFTIGSIINIWSPVS